MSRTHHHRKRPRPDVPHYGRKSRVVRFEWDAFHNGWRSDCYKSYKYGYWPAEKWRAAEKLVTKAAAQGFLTSSKVESDEAHIEGYSCPAMKRLRKDLEKLLGFTEQVLEQREAKKGKR